MDMDAEIVAALLALDMKNYWMGFEVGDSDA